MSEVNDLEALTIDEAINDEPGPVKLFIQNPNFLSVKALENICKQFGDIEIIPLHSKLEKNFIFGMCPNMSSAHQIIQKVNGIDIKKRSGIVVHLSKDNEKDEMDLIMESRPVLPVTRPMPKYNKPFNMPINLIDPPTIYLVSADNYKSGSLTNDPFSEFLIESLIWNPNEIHVKKEIKANSSNQIKSSTNGVHCKIKNEYNFTMIDESLFNKDNYGTCEKCNKPSNKMCGNCSTFYCSRECQMGNWDKHKAVCSNSTEKKKSVVSEMKPRKTSSIIQRLNRISKSSMINELNEEIKSTPIIEHTNFPKSGSIVVITAAQDRSCSHIFIRSHLKKLTINYIQNIQECFAHSVQAKPVEKLPQPNDICLALNSSDNLYYRALILQVENANHITVAFVDLGKIEIVSQNDLRVLEQRLQTKTRYTFRVKLADIELKYLNDSPFGWLTRSVQRQKKYRLEYNNSDEYNSNISVKLIDCQTKECLNQKLIELSVCAFDEPVFYKDMEYKTITGDNQKIVVINNDQLKFNELSVILYEDIRQLKEYESQMEKYGNDLPNEPYTPRQYEMCLVKCDDNQKWLRGCCWKIYRDGAPLIFLPDYNCFHKVKIQNIRPFPREFLFVCLTKFCSIYGVPADIISAEITEQLLGKFLINNVLEVPKITSTVDKDGGDECTYLHLDEYVQTLRDEKLID